MAYSKSKIVAIKGGLGNQLFQLAFAIFLQKKFNLKVKLDISWYKNQRLRKFQLNNFIKNSFLTIFDNYNQDFIEKLLFYRTEFFFQNLMKKNFLPPINYFNGYWQDIYFANYLCLNKHFKIENLKKFFNHDYYVIHLRAGDFLHSKAHYVLEDAYYTKYIELFKEKPIYVLCEDETYAKNFIKKNKINAKFVQSDEMISFRVILHASGGISSNSTFCWWAVFLSKSRNWIFPYRWLNKKNIIDHNLHISKTIII